MTSPLRRAGGFAVVGTLALAAPALGRAAAVPFAVVALGAAFVVDDGPLFDLFARPGDERQGRLAGLAGFALAAAGLALLATVPRAETAMPVTVYVAAVLVVAYGNLGERFVAERTNNPFLAATGFATVGFLAAFGGQVATAFAVEGALLLPRFAFLAAAGALAAALMRAMLLVRDDPLVMVTVGIQLWLFEAVATDVHVLEVAVALGVTVALGYASYALGAASVPGMLTGVLLGLLTIVFGGYGWFAVLVAFFVVGGLSTKFRYERKRERGVAEENEGARGTGNVLGNAAVALVAVIGYAAAPRLPVGVTVFQFAFAGSLAAAMSDTLSSEIGGLYDTPRLITTLEAVPPGTDGAVTWQGTVVGAGGAVVVAAASWFLLQEPRLPALAVVAVGGVVGMMVDSLLGATVEGNRIGNESVNLLATLCGALASAGLATLLS